MLLNFLIVQNKVQSICPCPNESANWIIILVTANISNVRIWCVSLFYNAVNSIFWGIFTIQDIWIFVLCEMNIYDDWTNSHWVTSFCKYFLDWWRPCFWPILLICSRIVQLSPAMLYTKCGVDTVKSQKANVTLLFFTLGKHLQYIELVICVKFQVLMVWAVGISSCCLFGHHNSATRCPITVIFLGKHL